MKPFNIKICHKLLYSLRAAGIQPDTAAAFLGQQVVSMQTAPPNYTFKNNKKHLHMKFENSYWIMRGFYPNTPIMFKIVMVDTSQSHGARDDFYAKVELINPTLQRKHAHSTYLNNKQFMDIMNDQANNILVGDTVPDPKIILTQRHPKCMSPKGIVVFNLKAKGV
jgi:hypothetical protein